MLQSNANLDEVRAVLPEEYRNWLDTTASALYVEWANMSSRARGISDFLGNHGPQERKRRVELLQEFFPDVFHEVLSYLDGNADKAIAAIWKKLRPAGNDVPVLVDGDDE